MWLLGNQMNCDSNLFANLVPTMCPSSHLTNLTFSEMWEFYTKMRPTCLWELVTKSSFRHCLLIFWIIKDKSDSDGFQMLNFWESGKGEKCESVNEKWRRFSDFEESVWKMRICQGERSGKECIGRPAWVSWWWRWVTIVPLCIYVCSADGEDDVDNHHHHHNYWGGHSAN